MNRWHNSFFSNLHAHSKLLYIHISDNCDKKCWFDVSMKGLRVALKPLTDTEIRVAFKEISSICEITPDKKRLRLIACNEAGVLPFADEDLKKSRKKFIKPSLTEIQLIVNDKILAQKFFNHYESINWRVGKNPMVNWQATANNWKLDYEEKNKIQQTGKKSISF